MGTLPNWVSTEIKITADKETIKRIVANVIDENDEFDFNRVVPMPESIRDTEAGTVADEYIAMALTSGLKEIKEDETWERLVRKGKFFGGVDSLKRAYERAKDRNYSPEDIEKYTAIGKKYLDNLEKYGYKDWYGWSIENWGTKWNACDSSYEANGCTLKIWFNTAWSVAEPIVWALNDQYDLEELVCSYCDEDVWGGNCGIFGFNEERECFDDYIEPGTEEWGRHVEDMWGYNPLEEEEDW